MFEPVPAEEEGEVLAAVREGRCVSCYRAFDGDGYYCPDCDEPEGDDEEDEVTERLNALANATCPYYRGIPGAQCIYGCWEEPSCQTDEPFDGWEPVDAEGNPIPAERLDEIAREHWVQHCARTGRDPNPPPPPVSFEQQHFGRDITCRGVYQSRETGDWYAYDFEGRHNTMRSAGSPTELEARRVLQARYLFADSHGWQMWAWMNAGDRGPGDALTMQQQAIVGGVPAARRGPRNVLRINGVHYIPRCVDTTSNSLSRGFGGRMHRWRWLDEPEGTVHFSDDVFTQGDVPDMMRHLLPDNAVWVTEERESC